MLLIFRNCMYDDLQVLEICCFNVMPSSKVTPRILTVLLNPIILVPTCSVTTQNDNVGVTPFAQEGAE